MTQFSQVMDGRKSVHSVIGGLAHALKGFSLPRSSIVISQELKRLSEEIKKEKSNSCSSADQSSNLASLSNDSRSKFPVDASGIQSNGITSSSHTSSCSSEKFATVTPICLTPQTISESTYEIQDSHCYDGYRANTQANWENQPNNFPHYTDVHSSDTVAVPTNSHTIAPSVDPPLPQIRSNPETDILYQPESLLKLLADDDDVIPDYSVESTDVQSDQIPVIAENLPQPQQKSAILRIPEYIKAPAKLFPLVIGTETYELPYTDSGSNAVILFQVVHAAGEFVVAKVTGCGPFDANKPYPEGIKLTMADEIKVIQTKSLSEMTIAEQLHYQSLKEEQERMIADSINRYNQQIPRQKPNSAITKEDFYPESEDEEEQYLNVGPDVVGTVVKVPEGDSLGLISCEINDDFITVPYTTSEIPMVGGETVLFDLALNCKTRKTEATRVKLAPLDANVKNVKNPALNGTTRRKCRNVKDIDLPLIASPPSVISAEKFSKHGMLGKVMRLPSKNQAGVIKVYIEKHYTRVEYKVWTKRFRIGAAVQFDLNVWFDTTTPFQADNVELAEKGKEVVRYKLQDFICEGLPDGKLWSLEDFRHLLLLLRNSTVSLSYDWKEISYSLKRGQGDIKNFLNVFVMHINKADNPDFKGVYNKKLLDKFVSSINKYGIKKAPVVQNNCNIENVPLSDRRRSRTPSTKSNTGSDRPAKSPKNGVTEQPSGKEKPSSPKTFTELKPTKRARLSEVPMVDSISRANTSLQVDLLAASHFSPQQSFVAKNLLSWSQVPKVPGDYEVNSVLGEVLTSCAAYTSKPPKSAGESSATATGETTAAAATTTAGGDVPDLGNVYRYIGGILANGEESNEIPVKLNGMESKIVVYLLQELFDDMAKRNLLPHKQFLLQRYFGFTGNKTQTGRTPINPFKLKGFLLHLPEPQSLNKSD